jgi:SpoVK/Ycf46/Vps4 family AAA+-type ATPase
MRKEFESIEWDSKKNSVVITKQTQVSVNDTKSMEDVKEKLKGRLKAIVGQVKILKAEAESIKSMLNRLEGKTESIPVSAQPPE